MRGSGLRGLRLQGFDQNRIWCAIVLLDADLTAQTQTQVLTGTDTDTGESERLRLRVLTIPAALARTA